MDHKVLQWSCQGVRGKKDELINLISSDKIDILALQETKLWTNSNFNISRYNVERKEVYFNHTPHGGVAIFIHNGIRYQKINLMSSIQAVAVQVKISQLVCICNMYSSRSHQIENSLVYDLYN